MADNERKANALIQEAKKKLTTSKGFFSNLFGGGSAKVDEATELYIQAANLFKISKNWQSAGDAFAESAQLHLTQGTKHEAASNYADAANCYKKIDANQAVQALMKTCEIYTDMGRFTMAAKHHTTIGEICENELNDYAQASANYERAADYYRGEESISHANKSMVKVAQMASLLEQYQRAAEVYEELGTSVMDSELLKYTAKDHFFRAAVCHLCVDTLNGQQAVERFEERFPAFGDSRECKLLKKLLVALEENNADDYTEACKDYDQISRMDNSITSMLLKVKKTISENDENDLR